MTNIFTKCIVCSKKLTRNYTGRKFCSRECYYVWQKENPNKGTYADGNTRGFQKGHKVFGGINTQFKKGMKTWNKGTHIKTNDALDGWRKKGGRPSWKGTHKKFNNKLEEWRAKGNSIKGKDHWNWKDGRSKLRERIEHLPEYRKWQKDCFQKAKGKCEDCEGNVKLIVHHKKLFSEILDDNKITTVEQAKECKELWDTKNGKVLCQKTCHRKYHSFL